MFIMVTVVFRISVLGVFRRTVALAIIVCTEIATGFASVLVHRFVNIMIRLKIYHRILHNIRPTSISLYSLCSLLGFSEDVIDYIDGFRGEYSRG